MKKTLLTLTLCALVLAITVCTISLGSLYVSAAESVSYIDVNYTGGTLVKEAKTVTDYTLITADTTELTDGFYVVKGEVTLSARLQVKGSAHLILLDGAHLKAPLGIGVNRSNTTDNRQLYIYAQSEIESSMGRLTAGADSFYAAIGTDHMKQIAGDIIINGGNISATGNTDGAGIGHGYSGYMVSGDIIINGGIVNAVGGANSAGIGASRKTAVRQIQINGGTVTATGTPGIGSLFYEAEVRITGGTVTATGNYDSVGIGAGKDSNGGSVVITGGTVTATGGENAAGIGVAADGKIDMIYITSTDVTATAGEGAESVGSGSGGTVGGFFTYEGKEYKVDGSVTLQSDLYIRSDEGLVIPSGATLTVPEGLNIYADGRVDNSGSLKAEGGVYTYGEVNCTSHTYTACACFCGSMKHEKGVYEFTNGFCENGCLEPPEKVSSFNYSYLLETHPGYYIINNTGKLFWFAQLVNGVLPDGTPQDTSANAIMTRSVDIGGAMWFPIGLYNDPAVLDGAPVVAQYTGHFDGNNCTVSNFVAYGNGSQGLFGYCHSDTLIENLGVIGAQVRGWNAGAIAGFGSNLKNCYARDCIITGESDVNEGPVTLSSLGANNYLGTEIDSCYAYNCTLIVGDGEEYVMHPVAGTLPEEYTDEPVKNSYYGGINTEAVFTSVVGATELTYEEFGSGKATYLLNRQDSTGPWKQRLGVEDFPWTGDYTPDQVYYGYFSCSESEVAVYTNDKTVSIERPPHVDENRDHVCDTGCGKDGIGEHADSQSDADHLCDYGCGASLESCSDENKDHICDVCTGETNMELHADDENDDDHLCDYGCGASLESCVDKNKDHICDICSEKTNMELHVDAPRDHDHLCDYGCGATLESCTDKNGDYVCDVCDTVLCWDNDKNHICDNCGGEVNQHLHIDGDADTDHLCDYGCGAVLSECTDLDGDRICDTCRSDLARGGLSVGAIIGISLASVGTLGLGGFAVFWFLVKKRSWADLLLLFKR